MPSRHFPGIEIESNGSLYVGFILFGDIEAFSVCFRF